MAISIYRSFNVSVSLYYIEQKERKEACSNIIILFLSIDSEVNALERINRSMQSLEASFTTCAWLFCL